MGLPIELNEIQWIASMKAEEVAKKNTDELLEVAGVIEAKPGGTTLSGTADQSDKYLFSLAATNPCFQKPLPFAYESTGTETFYRDRRRPNLCFAKDRKKEPQDEHCKNLQLPCASC